ncbi:hypothetical protein L484_018526 [Morus notabilis]|uniref:Uncharacterized protein n=1 Tax=Morus notabilis TaxID=981085 RepID=W9S3L5_9ROSA|nr:hypothetical protein L484_018526 [Morus notabilis]
MTQMWLLWWPRNTSSAAKRQGQPATTTATTAATATSHGKGFSTSSHCPSCLAKLVRKLKKQARTIGFAPSRQAAFECRYDLLSYSLNFDDSSALDHEDNHYKFCALSSTQKYYYLEEKM